MVGLHRGCRAAMVLLALQAFLAGAPAFGQDIRFFQHPMISHNGAEDESFQNPAAATLGQGLSLGLVGATNGGLGSGAYFVLPLPLASALAFNSAHWRMYGINSLSLASRFGKDDTADGLSFGMNMKWGMNNPTLYDPGIHYRKRLSSKGDVLHLGVYTFAWLGQAGSRDPDYNSWTGYQYEDEDAVRTELVVQGAWISPSGFWELSGSLEALTASGSSPGAYRFAYPIRHLEAVIRPVSWFRLGGKVTEYGVREFRFEGDWKYGNLFANRLKFQMAGLRDYYGNQAIVTRLQLSLFGNYGRDQR